MLDAANEVVELPPMNDDELLDFTQNLRRNLAKELTKSGMPTDTKDQITLLSTLDSIDKQAISKKKVAVAEKTSEVDQLVAMTMAKLSAQFGAASPFERPVIDGQVVAIPEPDQALLPRAALVLGETDTSNSSLTYDEFMAANDGK